MECTQHTGPKHAIHRKWTFRREAIHWLGNKPVRANLAPLSKGMALWLAQKSSELPIHREQDKGLICQPSNPYTYSLSAISLAMAGAVNDAVRFFQSTEPIDAVDAEIQRIRLESEIVIYAARFCEASIKQMLFCTNIPERLYQKASLGTLLAQRCWACWKAKKPPHEISLLGSLACRYGQCRMLDDCAFDHLQLVARRRNIEAAHSESQAINPRTPEKSRAHMRSTLENVGNEFGHLADHLGEVEEKMAEETLLAITSWPYPPPISALSRIPMLWIEQYENAASDEPQGST